MHETNFITISTQQSVLRYIRTVQVQKLHFHAVFWCHISETINIPRQIETLYSLGDKNHKPHPLDLNRQGHTHAYLITFSYLKHFWWSFISRSTAFILSMQHWYITVNPFTEKGYTYWKLLYRINKFDPQFIHWAELSRLNGEIFIISNSWLPTVFAILDQGSKGLSSSTPNHPTTVVPTSHCHRNICGSQKQAHIELSHIAANEIASAD